MCVSGAGGCPCRPALERAAVTVPFALGLFLVRPRSPGLSCGLRLWSARRLGAVSAPGSCCLLPWDTLRQLWGGARTGRPQAHSARTPLCLKSRLPRSPQRGPACRPPAGTPPGACLGCPCCVRRQSVSADPDLTERVSSLQPPSPPRLGLLPAGRCALSALSRARSPPGQPVLGGSGVPPLGSPWSPPF